MGGNPFLSRAVLVAMAIWTLGHEVEGKKNGGGSSWPSPTAKPTTPSPTISGENLLCERDLLTVIKGEWTADCGSCSMENSDSRCGNVVWIGSDDGRTPDTDFDCDCFELTVVLEIESGGDDAGVMFRTAECPETNNAGPTYYVGLDPGADDVIFGSMDDGWTELYSATVDKLCFDKEYTLSIRGCGDTYSVFVDGEAVLENVKATDFSSGSIGLRTYKAPSKYHHLSFSCDSSTTPAPVPTPWPTAKPTTAEPTAKPTASPSAEPSSKPTASPSAEPSHSPSADPTTPSPTTAEPSPGPTTPAPVPTQWPTARPTTSEPTMSPSSDPTVSSGCGCGCDSLGYDLSLSEELCGNAQDGDGEWFSCDGCGGTSCGDYLHCYRYSMEPKEPTVSDSDCQSDGVPHVPQYIVIPLRDDCEYEMDREAYYNRLWSIEMNGEVYYEPEYVEWSAVPPYIVHYADSPDSVSGVDGIQINTTDWDGDEISFTICTFNGDPDPLPAGTLEVGWAFAADEGRCADEYGFSCSNEVEIVDICTQNQYAADPTAKPTEHPTAKPTTAGPTEWTVVTHSPSSDPSADPTASPTTAEPTREPTAFPTFPVCDTDDALNIAFLMDESGSVDSDEWDVIVTFVDRIATYDVAGPSYVSLFEYASLVAFTQFLDWTPLESGRTAISNALTRNPYNSVGTTYTWDAVNRVLDEFWHYRKNCTDGCETRHDILFLLTDGAPTDTVCPDMVERANTTTVDIVIIGIGTYADSATNWMSQIDCLDVADDGEDIYYVTEFEAGDFNAIEGVIRNYTCSGEHPASTGDRGGDPWVYDDGSTGLGPVPTANGNGEGPEDVTPSPNAAAALVAAEEAGGSFFSWLAEGAHFFALPDELSTTAVVLVALAIFVAVAVLRRCSKNRSGRYKRVAFDDATPSDTEMSDDEAAKALNS